MERRRELLAMQSGLPGAYRRIEYIRGRERKAFIDTKFNGIGNNSLVIRGKCEVDGFRKYINIFGAYVGETYSTTRMIYGTGRNTIYASVNARAGSSVRMSFPAETFEAPFEYELTKTSLTINGTTRTYSIQSDGTVKSANIYINSQNDHPTAMDSYPYEKHFWFQILDGVKLVRDYVPCERRSDGKIGLYDLVNRMFVSSVGEEEFEEPIV